jgi:hypothetical protein
MGISTLIAILENCFAASLRVLDSAHDLSKPKKFRWNRSKKTPVKPAQGLTGERVDYGYEEV